MEPGEEDEVSNLVNAVFHRDVAPLFPAEGVKEFLRYVEPNAVQQRSNSRAIASTLTVADQ
jgi:hypothetical protein